MSLRRMPDHRWPCWASDLASTALGRCSKCAPQKAWAPAACALLDEANTNIAKRMLAADSIYVQVFSTRFVVRNVDSGEQCEVPRDQQYASPRMLIADFTTAQVQLKAAVKSVRRGFRAPEILVHPMELIEGGVTQVEYRVFLELGIGAGGSRVGVHVGATVPDQAVQRAIREYRH